MSSVFVFFAFGLVLTVLLGVSFSDGKSENSTGSAVDSPSNGKDYSSNSGFGSAKDMENQKKYCKELKEKLIKEFSQSGKGDKSNFEQSAEFQEDYLPVCKMADTFSYMNLTSVEAFGWLLQSEGDPHVVYNLAKGISQKALQEIIVNASSMGWGWADNPKAPALQAMGKVFVKRLGNLQSVTAHQLKFLGPAVVYVIPPGALDQLQTEVIDLILSHISSESMKAFANQGPPGNTQGQEPSGTAEAPAIDTAASIPGLIIDLARLKALCRVTWTKYEKIPDAATFNKTWILLWCAPSEVCKNTAVNIVQNNRATLTKLPLWRCQVNNKLNFGDYTKQYENFYNGFPQIAVCGRHIANKMMETGPNQLILNSAENLMSLRMLALCLQDQYLTVGVDLIGCSMAVDGVKQGLFSKSVERYVAQKCMDLPTDLSTVTCADISSKLGPLLKYTDSKFWSGLSSEVLCDKVCMQTFKAVELSSDVRMGIMNRCYGQGDVAITSETVKDLGAMVTKLPIDKLEEVAPADLAQTVDSIKQDYEDTKTNRKLDPRRKAVARTIAKKMATGGNIGAIADSKEIMKAVTLTDLKSSVTDIEQDLGIAEHDVALTDAQNKWAMRKIMEKQQATDFSADDIRSKKSLVKGFLSTDIKDMGQANNDSRIELAKALCEQTNWPLKPLKAINRDMIVQTLIARNSTHPMKALTEMDVAAIGCECMMHFKSSELLQMEKGICSAVCGKIGYCDNLRCLNKRHRKNVLQSCLICKDLGVNVFTSAEMDELGPNLISELSSTQVSTLVPSSVLAGQLGIFKAMCMTKSFSKAISSKLVKILGSDIDYDTLTLLGSGAMLLSYNTLKGVNMSYIASLAETFVMEMSPTDERLVNLHKCCDRWLQTDDIAHYNELKRNLLLTIKDAIIYKMQNPARKKRSTVSWTCENMRLVSEAFTTVSNDEINAMAKTEFIDCLADIGALKSWTASQKVVLLAKTESAFAKTVCKLATSDILNLGAIGEAMNKEQISCLPLDLDDVVVGFGSRSAWTADQLGAFATRYVDSRNLEDITGFTSSDIALVGHLLCGFTTDQLAGIPASTIAASGTQLGALSQCPVTHLVQLKTLAIQASAYGPIASWTAAEVGELKFLVAGLVGKEIQDLTVAALEGLSSEVIPKIPATTLKELTLVQLQAFTDVQAGSVTAKQRASMSASQTDILDKAATGGEEQRAEVTGAPPSAGSVLDLQPVFLLIGTALVMLLLSA